MNANIYTLVFEKQIVDGNTTRWVDCIEGTHYTDLTLAELAIQVENGFRPPGCSSEWRLRAISVVQRGVTQPSHANSRA